MDAMEQVEKARAPIRDHLLGLLKEFLMKKGILFGFLNKNIFFINYFALIFFSDNSKINFCPPNVKLPMSCKS